ncbi:MAG TPA: ATP-dependent sacrificial sulfur transferase LarE [Candidatus Brocadiia bacterium]|nr:ATP-dependent sacrificial sulfur transferase LarE [Candidatus Brocadiia bacterium]
MTKELQAKIGKVRERIRVLDSAAVAFSGGVDSTLVAKICAEELGSKALAVTARSETYPEEEADEARELAAMIGIRHVFVESRELDIEGYADNPPDRCYHCKRELLGQLRRVADEHGLKHIVDGANAEDTGDWRPGLQAAKELGAVQPLLEAGMTKSDIREVSRILGLPTWDKPAYACVASRFPYGERITADKLETVKAAERFLRANGFRNYRARYHGNVVRIELPVEDMPRALADPLRGEIVAHMKSLGFLYVALDLQGYRTGSMNEALAPDERNIEKK